MHCIQVIFLKSLNDSINTGDQLAIAKETGRRLGMGSNMYPSSALLSQDRGTSGDTLPVDELIETADGFAGVFPGGFCNLLFLKQHMLLEIVTYNRFVMMEDHHE